MPPPRSSSSSTAHVVSGSRSRTFPGLPKFASSATFVPDKSCAPEHPTETHERALNTMPRDDPLRARMLQLKRRRLDNENTDYPRSRQDSSMHSLALTNSSLAKTPDSAMTDTDDETDDEPSRKHSKVSPSGNTRCVSSADSESDSPPPQQFEPTLPTLPLPQQRHTQSTPKRITTAEQSPDIEPSPLMPTGASRGSSNTEGNSALTRREITSTVHAIANPVGNSGGLSTGNSGCVKWTDERIRQLLTISRRIDIANAFDDAKVSSVLGLPKKAVKNKREALRRKFFDVDRLPRDEGDCFRPGWRGLVFRDSVKEYSWHSPLSRAEFMNLLFPWYSIIKEGVLDEDCEDANADDTVGRKLQKPTGGNHGEVVTMPHTTKVASHSITKQELAEQYQGDPYRNIKRGSSGPSSLDALICESEIAHMGQPSSSSPPTNPHRVADTAPMHHGQPAADKQVAHAGHKDTRKRKQVEADVGSSTAGRTKKLAKFAAPADILLSPEPPRAVRTNLHQRLALDAGGPDAGAMLSSTSPGPPHARSRGGIPRPRELQPLESTGKPARETTRAKTELARVELQAAREARKLLDTKAAMLAHANSDLVRGLELLRDSVRGLSKSGANGEQIEQVVSAATSLLTAPSNALQRALNEAGEFPRHTGGDASNARVGAGAGFADASSDRCDDNDA